VLRASCFVLLLLLRNFVNFVLRSRFSFSSFFALRAAAKKRH
jgi:hypothetical protein